MPDVPSFSPRHWFNVNIKPAELMLTVYQLLDSGDHLLREGELVEELRSVVGANAMEDLLVIQNEIFLGLIREEASIPASNFKTQALAHLLRQAVVASCTALDAYLPALLRSLLPRVIEVRRKAFWPDDEGVRKYFTDITFDIDDMVRIIDAQDAHIYLSNKLLKATQNRYFSNRNGIHVTGALLGIPKPWDAIAEHLGQNKKELMKLLDAAVKRRNDIVHRADRGQSRPEGEQQGITMAQAHSYVNAIKNIVLALDELVDRAMAELERTAGGEAP